MSEFRESCPKAAEVIDRFRSVFGGDVKVHAVYEGDVSIETNAKKAESAMIEVSAGHYLMMGRLVKQAEQLASRPKRGKR